MSKYSFDIVKDFTGGENSFASPDNLVDGQLLICENVELFGKGGFRRRHGIEIFKDTGVNTKIDRIIEFEYNTAGVRTLRRLVLIGGNLIDADTNITIKTGLGSHIDYEVFKNKLYILGNDLFLVYDGTTIADVTNGSGDSGLANIKKCKYIEQRGQRLFACGNDLDPNALYFCEIGDPTYWKLINIIIAITDDADRLTGLKEYHGALVVFKTRGVFAWFGYDPYTDVQFQQLSVHTGTRAYRTIQRVGDYLFYLGEDGVYALQGTYQDVIVTKKVSKNITPRIKLNKLAAQHHLNGACAVFYDGKYMLSIPTVTSTTNDLVCVFYNNLVSDQVEECWSINTGWHISEFLKSLDGTLYSSSSVTGILHKHNETYNDLETAINVHVKVRPLAQDVYVHNKKYRRGFLWLQQFEALSSHAVVKAYVDYAEVDTNITPDESLVWDSDDRFWDETYWDFTDLVTRRFKVNKKGRRIIVDISDNQIDEGLTVYGFEIEYKIKKPSRR